MSAVARTLGVSRSNLYERTQGANRSRGAYRKPGDAALLELIRRLVDERPTYGYRRITALARRELARVNEPLPNHKRVYRLMKRHGLLLRKSSGRRDGRVHDGKVVVMSSNLRWCSDGFEFACWNGDIVRAAFVIDAHDRELIAHVAVSGRGISGSDVRDMMLEAVETRFATLSAPRRIEFLSDNGSPYTAKDTRDFAMARSAIRIWPSEANSSSRKSTPGRGVPRVRTMAMRLSVIMRRSQREKRPLTCSNGRQR